MKIAAEVGVRAVVTVGLHVDAASPADIALLSESFTSVLAQCVKYLRGRNRQQTNKKCALRKDAVKKTNLNDVADMAAAASFFIFK